MTIGSTVRGIVGKAFNNELVGGLTLTESVTLGWPAAAREYNPATGTLDTPESDPPDEPEVVSESRFAQVRNVTANQVARANQSGELMGALAVGDLEVKILHETGKHQPKGGDTITFESVVYHIFAVPIKRFDGQPLMFTCYARRM